MADEPKYNIEVIAGFEIRCNHPACRGSLVGFEKKRVKAEELKVDHKAAHIEHEKRVAAKLAQFSGSSTADPKLQCPTCLAEIGQPHNAACDVARCLETGAQRRFRDHIPQDADGEHHKCGMDLWTGYFPGEKEANEYGVPMQTLKSEGYWDKEKVRWILPADWQEKLNARHAAQQEVLQEAGLLKAAQLKASAVVDDEFDGQRIYHHQDVIEQVENGSRG